MDFDSSNPVILLDAKGKRVVARPFFVFDPKAKRLVPSLSTKDDRKLEPVEGEDGVYLLGKRRLTIEATQHEAAPRPGEPLPISHTELRTPHDHSHSAEPIIPFIAGEVTDDRPRESA
jgi:hypothetical protein